MFQHPLQGHALVHELDGQAPAQRNSLITVRLPEKVKQMEEEEELNPMEEEEEMLKQMEEEEEEEKEME